ncbi:putative aldouronate transport system substrate-binding protein [Paenibacillus castaneae]|uniref:extracellular solute-binding protein n=1 Tax=Paenibacillus castaneae TaxID=474957 RepID=UPI000C9BC823|nr:extracellular solute-binding protein [Paenibacillus castaneae]NIK77096.1 putative aldouronate transport system substrate-binding protein [Paenibacillus castaneae]
MKGKYTALVLLVFSLLFAGCSSNGNTENVNKVTGENSGTQTQSKAVWFSTVDFWNPPATWSTDPNTVQGAITEKTGLTFEFNIPAQDGDTKLNLMLVSGDNFPDVVTVTNDVLIKKLIEAGKVWDLEEFLKKYDPDSHLLTDFPADVKETIISRDGGFYAYPSHINSEDARAVYPPSGQFYIDLVDYGSNNGILVNGNLLKEAGLTIDDIKSESGLLEAYKKMKDLTVDGAPVIPLLVDGKGFQDPTLGFLQDTFGAMPVDKDGNFRDKLLAPETKEALQFLYKAQQGEYFEPGQMTVDNAAVKADIASGRVFTFIGNTANTSFQLNDYWTSSGPVLSETGTTPVLAKDKRAGGGWMKTFISKTTKQPEKLAKWISFMTSKEGMLLHIYGFEGIHYNFDGEGHLIKTEQGLKDAAEYMTTGLSAFWPFHHTTFSYSIQQAPTEDTDLEAVTANRVQAAYGKSQETKIFDSASFNLPADLFPASSNLANDELQIKTYKEAQIAKIIMAKNDGEFSKLYDDMIVQLKKLGIENLDKERNKYVQDKNKEYGISVKGINS